jgi:hypothetical protein
VNAPEQIWHELDVPRLPSDPESRLLTALSAAVREPLLHDQVSSVVVDAVCRCGCSSVRLRSDRPAIPAQGMAELSSRGRPDYFAVESFGRAAEHEAVSVVLHVIAGSVAELEIFDAVNGEGAAVALDGLTELATPTLN